MNDAPPPYRLVLFDCDSTLSAIEGIDELSSRAGVDARALTERAMSGALRLEDVYAERLAAIRPTRAQVEAIGALYVEHVAPNAAELLAALRFLGKEVAIVSGGLLPAVLVLARALELPEACVHAVALRFGPAGDYLGFDEGSPLARSGGKLEVVRALARDRPAALVGDGVTDMEAAPALARFVAFGGFARRAPVFALARVACAERDFAELLPHLCSPDEIERLAAHERHAALARASRRGAAR